MSLYKVIIKTHLYDSNKQRVYNIIWIRKKNV